MRELEMSKNRDQKVVITDEAINKVPLIKYKGIPENEYVTIQELSREVLAISKKVGMTLLVSFPTPIFFVFLHYSI